MCMPFSISMFSLFKSQTDNKQIKVHERSKKQLSLKELSPQDKKRVANLVKELAKVGEERVNAEERLQAERKAFEEVLVRDRKTMMLS